MISFLKKNSSIFSLLIVSITVVLFSYHNRVKDNLWQQTVTSDGRGYYAYLPATFIYHDWDWDFVFQQEHKIYPNNPEYVGDYLNIVDGEKINKYYIGTSILWTPFFLSAFFLSKLLGYPVDGYSLLFLTSIALAAIFYLIMGLYYVRKTLQMYNFSEVVISITILCFGLGTNLFYYTYYEPSMSHVYSFFLISAFCFHAKKIADNFNNKSLIYLIGISALISITRPLNVIIIFTLPFFFESFKLFYLFVKNVFINYKALLLGIIITSIIISTQLITYYLQAGKFWIYAYKGETFNFLNPHFLDILFSYRKGLFIYTPICFVALMGIFILYKKNKFQALSWLLFFIFCTFLLSSWHCWWYGGSYGLRAYIEFYPLFSILFAFLMFGSGNYGKLILVLMVTILTYINFIQEYQYQNYFLHWEDMNKEKYWNIFLKTDDIYRGVLWEKEYIDTYKDYNGKLVLNSFNNFETSDNHWVSNGSVIDFSEAHSGNKVSKIGVSNMFSESFIFDKQSTYKSLIIKTNAFFYLTSNKSRGRLIISLENDGKTKTWNFRLTHTIFEEIKLQTWLKHSYNVKVENIDSTDVIKIYYMNDGQEDLFLDDFTVNIFENIDYKQAELTIQREDKIHMIIEKIKLNKEWFESIKIKAAKQRISLDEMIEKDAEYILNQELN